MSFPQTLDSAGLLRWARRTVGELSRRRAEINELNVFPVPDADTGSNMAHTMEAAVTEAEKGGDVVEALAIGSVRGARGNSGMVISQVLRGVADSTVNSAVDGAVVAQSLALAVKLVDRALSEPVEGTVVTVLRAAADAAAAAAARVNDLHAIIAQTVDAARAALAKTPSQLKVLRDAGVVDAGGAGLVILLESLLAEVEGAAVVEPEPCEESEAELEVVFFFEGDVDALGQRLATMGNSLAIARLGESEATVHIHSTRAGEVIEYAFASGKVTSLRLEALPGAAGASSAGRTASGPPTRRVFVAAAPGPVAELFASVGATVVDPGETVDSATDDDIVISNAAACENCRGHLITTGSYVEGIAAVSVYEPDNSDTAAVVTAMRDAARSMRVGRPRRAGSDEIVQVCQDLLTDGGEQVTVLTSQAVDVEELSARLGVEVMAWAVPGIETEVGVE